MQLARKEASRARAVIQHDAFFCIPVSATAVVPAGGGVMLCVCVTASCLLWMKLNFAPSLST